MWMKPCAWCKRFSIPMLMEKVCVLYINSVFRDPFSYVASYGLLLFSLPGWLASGKGHDQARHEGIEDVFREIGRRKVTVKTSRDVDGVTRPMNDSSSIFLVFLRLIKGTVSQEYWCSSIQRRARAEAYTP